jgi:hypothetical protein
MPCPLSRHRRLCPWRGRLMPRKTRRRHPRKGPASHGWGAVPVPFLHGGTARLIRGPLPDSRWRGEGAAEGQVRAEGGVRCGSGFCSCSFRCSPWLAVRSGMKPAPNPRPPSSPASSSTWGQVPVRRRLGGVRCRRSRRRGTSPSTGSDLRLCVRHEPRGAAPLRKSGGEISEHFVCLIPTVGCNLPI